MVVVSQIMDFHFISITRENFDMVMGQSTYFSKGIYTLMQVLRNPCFRERFGHLGGYGFEDSGKILYSNI
jgi:molybdate-binding protein